MRQKIYFNNPPLPPFRKGGVTSQRMKLLHVLNQLRFCILLSARDPSLKKGFTFLEVLIALAIVGGLLVTVIYTLNYHLGIVERHEAITIATFLAKKKMAELEKNPVRGKGDFEEPYRNYSYETFVRDSPYPGIAEIIVEVKAGKEEIKLNEFIFE